MLSSFLGRLKLPWLFGLSVIGLLLNILIPDPVPFLDEVLMATLAAWLGTLRKPKSSDAQDDASRG